MEDFDEEAGSAVESQEPSSSTGTPNRPIRPATAVRSRLGRQTLVCMECKRLKLKCNRRTPCDKCIDKKRECKYDPGALTKVDVQSVHNTQIRHQYLLEAITHFLGISEDEVQLIMNAPTYPPRPDYPGPTVDVKRLRAVLGIEGSSNGEPIPRNMMTTADLFALASIGRSALLPPAIVTFSRSPPQIPNPSSNIFNPGSATITRGRSQIPSVMVDLATRVFQANSIVISHHPLAQLQLWNRVLGWEPRPANEGSIPAASIQPVATASAGEEDEEDGERNDAGSSSRAKPKKPDGNTILVTAPPSEIEYHDQRRPKDLSVVALAHEVFIVPAIIAQQQAVAAGNAASPHLPYTFSALGFAASGAPSTSSPQPPPFSGLGAPQASSPRSSISPPPGSSGVLPLVTPQVVSRYLPSKAWRTAFMHEFDTLMINHDGIGLSGRHSVLKKRIELMFEWADGSMKRLSGSGGESGPDSASTFSNSSSSLSSRGRRSGPSGRGRGKSEGRDLKPLPPPPTVGLFAVACAVYALGALSYASKSIHGRFPEDEDAETEMQDAGNAGTGEMPPPSFVPGLAGPPTASPNPTPISPLNPASMNFTLAGGADPHSTWGINLPESSSSRQAQTSSLNPHLHPLADKATPSNLLNLARAALLVHDESSLPASLDYLHAHMLTWLYLLHPSDSASSLTSCGFQGASTGVGSGGMTVVEQTIYKELGKCVSVARAMGLDLVDRPSMMKPRGAAFAFGRTEESEEEDEGMGIWEKEMRRRVWWQLMMFDQQISDNMGKLALIPPGTYACKPPSEADESVFGPTATAIPKPPETAKGYNTTYFAAKCQLLAIIKTLSYSQLEDGGTMDLARQLENRVSNWRTSLPAQYKLEFREKPEDTSFPELDTVDVQACDLHIMANVFLLRLWLPFFNEALSSTSQSNHGVLLTATTAANAVIVASHHLVTRFRAARPMTFGHYDFGNSVWFATGILASVVTMKSDVIFSSTARRGVDIAAAIFRNQVVEGKSDSTYTPKYEVNKIMGHITRLVAEIPKGKKSTGSKRKSDADVGQMKMRYGVPLPYLGTATITSATDISQPNSLRPESAFASWRSPPHQDSDDMSSASASWTRPGQGRNGDRATGSDVERMPGSQSMDEGSSVAPAPLNEAPGSRASSVASRMSTSQTSSSQSGRSRPAVGRRLRTGQGASQYTPPTSTSVADQPREPKRSRSHPVLPGLTSAGEFAGPVSPHNPTYPLSSTQPEPVMTAPPNQPSTMRPPPIHHMSAPNPILHHGRHSQGPQHRHGVSPSVTVGGVTVGGYHAAQEFSQPPQPSVPPGHYPNPSSQGQQTSTSSPYGYFPQDQSRTNMGSIISFDSRAQGGPHQAYSSPASLPQNTLPGSNPQVDGYLSNLQPTGGTSVSHQPESFNQPAGNTHMNPQENNLGGFDITSMFSNSAHHPSVVQTGGPSHHPPPVHGGQQYAGHPQADQHHQYAVGPMTEVTWTNAAPGQGWTHPDPSNQYMGPHS